VTAEESRLLEKLDLARLPRHVAVIMDGNGRWAQKRHLPRIAGHRAGTKSARTTIETCARLKIEALTLYAFSVGELAAAQGRDRLPDAALARISSQKRCPFSRKTYSDAVSRPH